LKKENKELRQKLKNLNGKLTEIIDHLKTKPNEEVKKHGNIEVLRKELENCESQTAGYVSEINFLTKRLEEGDQFDKIKELQVQEGQLKFKEDALKFELKRQNVLKCAIASRQKRETRPGLQKSKVEFLVEKNKVYSKKVDTLELREHIKGEDGQGQLKFLNALFSRYQETCQKLNVAEECKIVNLEDGRVKFEAFKKPKEPEPQSIKKNQLSVMWERDHPDHFEVVQNTKHFNHLKEKVKQMVNGMRIESKQTEVETQKYTKRMKELEQKETKIGNES
jgi:hypothetical protein